ncbi:serine hydrolase [uncultured Muriicola sp.]|uniref:serine hydrolase domain-containing protein n=1 Tax=uncultured Muriicola sp. TaxID=1583102 RepID=UPI002615751A|nr:serine hydrolase domain-containing protein [uncultured Muriicola sp.]
MGLISYIRQLFFSDATGEIPGNKGNIKLFDALMQEFVDTGKVPGMSITVLKKGEKLFQKGYGYADLDKKIEVDPGKTLFRIASASKPIAAIALAKMVADKKIDLDTSFYKYVPYFPKKEFDFTIRQLASHTAGIRGYRGKEYALNQPYSIKESLKIFQDDPLEFPPGTDYLYTSFDWVMISLAMEEVSGIPFSEYVKKEVLDPLGMHSTHVEYPEVSRRNKATPYTRRRSGFRLAIPVDNQYKLAGGGYLSTSEDLAKLGQASLENALIPAEIMTQFLTPQWINGNSTYYGLGWQVSEDSKGRPFIGHVGNGIGGYSNFFVYPHEEVVIALLINCTDPRIQIVLEEEIYPLFFTEATHA